MNGILGFYLSLLPPKMNAFALSVFEFSVSRRQWPTSAHIPASFNPRLHREQSLARSLVSERRMQRPSSGRAWEAYAAVMERTGDLRAAYEARKRAFDLGIGQGGVGAH